MAKNSIRDYDATSGNNTDIQSVDVSEGCPASGINNALRELMTDLKNVSTGAVALETPAADQLNVDNIRIDGNTISSTDTNGDITLDPNGTGKLFIQGSSSSGATPRATSVAVIDGNDNTQLSILGGASSVLGINFGDSSDNDQARITCNTTSGSEDMAFTVNAATRMTIDSSGFVGIGESTPRKMLHITKNDSDGLIVLDADGATTDHQICFSKDYGTGGTTGGNYWGIGVDGSENKLVFAYDPNAQASLSADAKVVLDSNGKVNIGTTAVDGFLQVKHNNNADVLLMLHDTSGAGGTAVRFKVNGTTVGSISNNSSSTAFNTSSDHRLKQGVEDMTGAIDRVKALAPKRFQFIADADTTVDGFLAHEAQAVVPEAVTGTHNEVDDDGNAVMQGIDQSKLVPLLTGALQEAIAKIETLETQRADLETRLTALENA